MVGDLNRDNIDDLVISAPVYGSEGNYQQGRVYILYGKLINGKKYVKISLNRKNTHFYIKC